MRQRLRPRTRSPGSGEEPCARKLPMLSGAPMSLRGRGLLRYVFEMRIPFLVLAAAVLISACGSVGAGSSPSPSPSASSNPMSFDVTVTETTKAASIRVGQKFEVVLHAANGMNNWTQPRSSDESILAPIVNPAATALRGVTLAAFQARSQGQVDVHAGSTELGACDRRKLARHPEGPHRHGLVEVCHQHRMLARHDEHVTVCDGLNIHERDHGVVLVGEARRLVAAQDLAENALIAHSASAKLKGA